MSIWKCPQKWGQNLKKPPKEFKIAREKLNHLVTLERGHLSWFRYPTHNIGTYLGRGAPPPSHLVSLGFWNSIILWRIWELKLQSYSAPSWRSVLPILRDWDILPPRAFQTEKNCRSGKIKLAKVVLMKTRFKIHFCNIRGKEWTALWVWNGS